MAGPFSHIRVLDLSRILAGPWAAQMLADLGAEVIKIERRGEGDDTRKWGPPFLKDADGKETAESAYYLSTNRGKKSVAVDLATPRGQALVAALADRSQVVIENFRVGGAARFGLDYDTLAARNPGLVYCSITGFGQTGPYRDCGGYDFMIQAMGGLMSITGEADDRPGGGPQKAGLAVSDLFTGMYASVAINAALAHRERTGEGQHIDLALLDSTVAILSMMASNYFLSGTPPTRMGNAHPNVAPYRLFATADGHVVVAIGNDAQFGRYCTEIGLPAIAADPRFRDNSARLANRDALDDILSKAMMARTTDAWLSVFEAVNVPSAPVNDVAQVFADRQVIARGMKIGLAHELGVEAPHAASPIKLSATPVAYTGSAPTLGGQTDQVLSEILELDAQEIAVLRAENII